MDGLGMADEVGALVGTLVGAWVDETQNSRERKKRQTKGGKRTDSIGWDGQINGTDTTPKTGGCQDVNQNDSWSDITYVLS